MSSTSTPSSRNSASSPRVRKSASTPKKTGSKKAGASKTVAKKVARQVVSNVGRRKAIVTNSPIHGRGVVAARDLAAGERICEYKGERIGWPEALRRHPHDPEQPFHTFYFSLDDDHVIDGNVTGNYAKWINHSCAPNCEADLVEINGQVRIFISALRNIKAGEELVYNYGLALEERYTPTLKKQFECRCGSRGCTGTMLAPKR